MTTKSRPLAVRPLPGKAKNRTSNEYRSQCKVCGLGVFRTQPHEWQHGRPGISPGLVHTDCIEGEPCNP